MYRPLQFHKRGQYFIGAHYETLRRRDVRLQSTTVRPLQSIAETQLELQPALLRLSAITSQYLTAIAYY